MFLHRICFRFAHFIAWCIVVSRAIEVSFSSYDGFQLEGTLHLPKTDDTSVPPSRVGVVLIHGSGPLSRHSVMAGQLTVLFGFSIPVFDEIATALVERGIAVLTYDKRTCGAFNNMCPNNAYPIPSSNLTAHDFLQDALAAVKHMETVQNIPNVVVVGHSQSGRFIPILLEQHPTLSGGVILAGAFHHYDEILRYQLEYTIGIYELFGYNETVALNDPPVAALLEFVEAVEAMRNGTSDDPYGGLPATFYRSLFDIREQALVSAGETDLPMLILNGEQDWNNPPSEAVAWADHLNATGSTNFELKLLPCITHAMNCLSQPDRTLLNPTQDFSRRVEPVVTQALVEFALEVSGAQSNSQDDTDTDSTSSIAPSWMTSVSIGLLSMCILIARS